MVSFVYGDPDADSLPLEDMAEAAEFLAENNRRETLAYANPVGPDGLAVALAEKLRRDNGIEVEPEQILLSAGSSSGLGLVVDMLVDPGDVVLADAPAWMGATNMFKLAGADVIGVEVDEDGVDPAKVAAALDKLEAEGRRAKCLYTIPTFQNPSGVELSLERRSALAKLADERGLLILEDDAYIDLRFEGEKKPTHLQPGAAGLGAVLRHTLQDDRGRLAAGLLCRTGRHHRRHLARPHRQPAQHLHLGAGRVVPVDRQALRAHCGTACHLPAQVPSHAGRAGARDAAGRQPGRSPKAASFCG